MNTTKMCVVIRKDLQMRKGKFCSQSMHSMLMAILQLMNKDGQKLILDLKKHKIFQEWLDTGQTKITLYCDSEEELLDIYREAKNIKINCSLVTDAGHTEFNGIPTNTAICLGPDYSENINKLTGHLKLL